MNKQEIIETLKSILMSPLPPTDAYGISLKARLEEFIEELEEDCPNCHGEGHYTTGDADTEGEKEVECDCHPNPGSGDD